ncbi:hypothetical protein A4D02_17305 [Niastella koreensis]|uniref:Colicin V processing peptidase n=2 Tax=Niastella koreensis TaxID=354356 RepID=G8TE39_NIAKG|nr:peptidase domain-containing ABC transporter [Niastella koreensis]AEV97230.1 colicin V processing peptidase [Niastella koreensis GR20-10]OQP39093.1 hypothetical protein A4D02_17305 [Niastella koreensis]
MAFPHYYQLEARDCGPTCLRMIAASYGKKYTLAELKEFCGVTRLGVSLQDIIDGAGRLGFETLPLQFPIEKIVEIPLPAILFWRQEHYVVLYKIKQTRKNTFYYISDPSFGKICLSQEVFAKQWTGKESTGVALLLETTDAFYKKEPVPYRKWESLSKFGQLFRNIVQGDKKRSLLALILICIAMVCTWFFPGIFRKMIDEGVQGRNMHIVFSLLIAQVVVFSSKVIADSISTILLMQINFRVSVQFLVNYLQKLIRLPLKIFDTKINADLMLRMDDSDRIQSFLTHHSLELTLSFVNLVIFSVMLYLYNASSFYMFLGISSMSILWTILFLDRRKMLDYSRFSVAAETRNNIYELITEMPEIKINNAHTNKINQWEKLQRKLNTINLRSLYLNYYQLVGANFFNKIKDILITAFCAWLVIHNHMTLGVMMTISFILGQLNSPIDNLINTIRGLQDARLSFDRLEEIQRLKDEHVGKSKILPSPPAKAITIQNLSFKYEGSFNPLVLHDINITIPVGKITAIVGASGSGKTTLLKLLLAIYDPTVGDIYLDNHQLRTLEPDVWRIMCGVVLQNGYIYSGTYAENIALADEKPDMEKVMKAAALACIDEFIEKLPLGYHTQIGKTGIDISGGQKQRILIARAIYRNPGFIFLDEATSNLDANNERKIMNNLHQFFAGKTVVIIAHRLSTVKNADQIIVLEQGRIVESGDHDSLVQLKDKYFHLVKNQLELGA